MEGRTVSELPARRLQTKERIGEIRSELGPAAKLADGKACVYATGSYGRAEASKFSDLDLFILGKNDGIVGPDGREGNLLKRLDEICIKADLIEITRKMGISEFSGDGKYLIHYSVQELTKTLGTQEDDVTNTFTARLLLLLESRPLMGDGVYHEAVDDVIAAYWRDYEDHKATFIPAFLANDILRLWRTFCVNYEARTERVPDEQKAKGKVKNYKLKHNRLLTCYSALLYLLAIYDDKSTVDPGDARKMISLTPTERLEWLMGQSRLAHAHAVIEGLLAQYDIFLSTSNVEERTLISSFMDKAIARKFMEGSYKFGDLMFEAINKIGNNSKFHRLLVV